MRWQPVSGEASGSHGVVWGSLMRPSWAPLTRRPSGTGVSATGMPTASIEDREKSPRRLGPATPRTSGPHLQGTTRSVPPRCVLPVTWAVHAAASRTGSGSRCPPRRPGTCWRSRTGAFACFHYVDRVVVGRRVDAVMAPAVAIEVPTPPSASGSAGWIQDPPSAEPRRARSSRVSPVGA